MLMHFSVRQQIRQCGLFFLTTRRSHCGSLCVLLTPKALLPREIVSYAFLDIFSLVVVFFLDQQIIRLWKTMMTKMCSVASGPIRPHSPLCVVLGDPDDQMWKVSLLDVIDKMQILSKYRHNASFRQIFCEYMLFFVAIKKSLTFVRDIFGTARNRTWISVFAGPRPIRWTTAPSRNGVTVWFHSRRARFELTIEVPKTSVFPVTPSPYISYATCVVLSCFFWFVFFVPMSLLICRQNLLHHHWVYVLLYIHLGLHVQMWHHISAFMIS